MTEYPWSVQILWADGTSSITHLCTTEAQARQVADFSNEALNTNPYYVKELEEPWLGK